MSNFRKTKLHFLRIITIFLILVLVISVKIFISSIISYKNKSKKESKRIIEENNNFESDVEKICKKASTKLQNYYQTYDSSLMDVSQKSLDIIEYYPDYIKAIFNLLENEGEMQENLMNYIKHAASAFMFLILGIVCAVAWIFFCFFCCCNCCCCCCCKKPECKCTFLFAPLICDLAVIICCVVGIFTSGKMFTGLADVECSIMKFISEINSGEKKEGTVKWVGFDEILKTFDNIKSKINTVKTEKQNELNEIYEELTTLKTEFPDVISDTYEDMLDPEDPFSPLIFSEEYFIHIIEEGTVNNLDVGVLDVLYNYGPITNDEKFLYKINEQLNVMTKQADEYLLKAHNSMEKIFQEDAVSNMVDSSKKSIEEISLAINSIKDEVVKYIVDYSDPIENYGKYIVKIIYIVILCLSVFSGISIILMYITAEECCYGKCCCGKGFAKTLSHISWNLMSLVLIFSFIICGIVFLFSYIGKDLSKVISILFGQNNLNSKNPKLIKGDISTYFKCCFQGDGNLADILGLTSSESSTNEFDELKNIMNDIYEIKGQIYQEDTVINKYKEEVEKRKEYKDVNIYDFNTTYWINLDSLIINFNYLIKNEEGDVWTLNGECPDDYDLVHIPEDGDVQPKPIEEPISKHCLDFFEWKYNFTQRYETRVQIMDDVYKYVLEAAKFYVKEVNGIIDHIDSGIPILNLESAIETVENAYNDVLEKEKETLELYNKTIYDLISVFDELNKGGDSLFSFLNCKFMLNNVLIILKNLEGAFAGNVQRIGLTFVFASFGMLFSIVFMILEIVILNVSLYLQKRRKQKEEQITMALAGQTRVMTFADSERKEKDNNKKMRNKIKQKNIETTSNSDLN